MKWLQISTWTRLNWQDVLVASWFFAGISFILVGYYTAGAILIANILTIISFTGEDRV